MRSADFNSIPDARQRVSTDEKRAVFRRMAFIRAFELNVKKAFDAKLMKMPIYLSVGQEAVAAALSTIYEKPQIFGQHRAHDVYLAYGADPAALVDELLHRATGCARGMGGSASIHSPAIGMYGHDGHMGTQVPIGVGMALGSGKRTLIVMGDASGEEDYVLGAIGYAAHKQLPIMFVSMDNNLSILTEVRVRRSWQSVDMAQAFGIHQAADIADDPWTIIQTVKGWDTTKPMFLNVRVSRHLWHAGTGTDGPPEWHRYEIVKEQLRADGLGADIETIEHEEQERADNVWRSRLQHDQMAHVI